MFRKFIPPLRMFGLSIASGVMAGAAAALFLYLLDWATQIREADPRIIWFLPIAGLLIGALYWHFGQNSAKGNNLILEEIHDPRNTLPLRMAPLVLFTTLLTHLFGGSAGREGTVVQMGASLSDQLSRIFRISSEERRTLLMCGAGAGFGAAIGAPWAGMIFGMEVIQVGRLKFSAPLECFVASFVGYFTTKILAAPHSAFPVLEAGFSLGSLFWVGVAGLIFGGASRGFTLLTHFIESIHARWIKYPAFKPMLGGLVLLLGFFLLGSYRYAGLGISTIQDALLGGIEPRDPFFKAIFTAITIGSGFKGGEFIPLVFIGATLGSALSLLLPVSAPLLAAVGFAAVFAGAANTPLACAIMAIELFGISTAPYAIVGCFMSYYFSGQGIYRAQLAASPKHAYFSELIRLGRKLQAKFLAKK